MAENNKDRKNDGTSAESRALEFFTNSLIEKIETLQGDWQKPWFSPTFAQAPKNLSGRNYNGGNSIILMMVAEKNGYECNRWATFDRIVGLNLAKDKSGKTIQLKDKDGNPLPRVTVNKGEKSTPVSLTTFTCVHKETKEKIRYEDFRQMSEEQRKDYNVYPRLSIYNVFNIAAQTNIKEARPDLYEKLMSEVHQPEHKQGEMYVHPAIDKMIDDNLWVCPIKQVHGDDAFYSISRDSIQIPERQQFKDGELFVSNTLHEATHSLQAKDRLGIIKDTASFGSKEYARCELHAELTAAFVSANYGLVKHVKDDSAAYLKSWLGSLKENPEYIKTLLTDVKKASSIMIQRIDAIQLQLDRGKDADFSQIIEHKDPFAKPSPVKNSATEEQNEDRTVAAKGLNDSPKQEQEEEYHYRRGR